MQDSALNIGTTAPIGLLMAGQCPDLRVHVRVPGHDLTFPSGVLVVPQMAGVHGARG